MRNRIFTTQHLRNSKGAIDLMSTLFGVLVIAILAAVAIAGFTLLLPWVQDEVIKNQLSNISSAQSIHKHMSKPSAYGTMRDTDLTINGSKVFPADPPKYCTVALNDGKNYVSYGVSDSGKVFTNTDLQTKIVETTFATAVADCPDLVNPSVVSVSGVWVIEDDVLRGRVKTLLGVAPADDLLLSHASLLDNTYSPSLDLSGIATFAGLEQATNLTQLSSQWSTETDTAGVALWTLCPATGVNLADNRGLSNIEAFDGSIFVRHPSNTGCAIDNTALFNSLRDITGSLEYRLTDAIHINGFQNLRSAGGGIHLIANPSLISINGFNAYVGGDVIIRSNANLTSISGFNGQVEAETIEINSNPSLTSISGFNGQVEAELLIIQMNGSLTNINGWQNLTTVGVVLSISSNHALTTLNAFPSLTSAQQLSVNTNNSLTSISGFNSLTTVGFITISLNPTLEQVVGFDGLTSADQIGINESPTLTLLDGFHSLATAGRITFDTTAALTVDAFQNLTTLSTTVPHLTGSLIIQFHPGGGINFVNGSFQNLTSVEHSVSFWGPPGNIFNLADFRAYLGY